MRKTKATIFVCGFVVALLVVVRLSSARMTEKEAKDLFIEAEIAYKNGEIKAAIAAYESILTSGLDSGPLYYNLGNSYYREGNLGRAVLHYERAKRLMPRDRDLIFNIAYAISSLENPVVAERRALSFLKSLSSRFSLDEMVLMALVLYLAGGLCALASLYWRWPRKRVWLIGGILSSGFLLAVALFLFAVRDQNQSAIILKATEARFEPALDGTAHFNCFEGMKVKIVDGKGLWLKVRRPDGNMGWIPADAAQKI